MVFFTGGVMEAASSQDSSYQAQHVPFSELLSRDDTHYAHGMGVAIEELMSAGDVSIVPAPRAE
jgi:hypothetical protein